MVNVALAFREMHQNSTPLRLPNAWDAGSARIFEDLGAPAIATTSAGVSWAFGYPDGNVLPVRLLAELTANIVRVIRIPLSVDVEAGYAQDPANVGEVLKPVLAAGPVGINIEDGKDAPEVLATKIESIRKSAAQLGVELFINARTDVYLQELVPEERRVEETYQRASRYRSAGADGLFVPALVKPKEITMIAQEIQMPLNVLAWPGLPKADVLGELGVRRLSAGPGIPQVLWQHAAELARHFLETGDSKAMSKGYMAHGKLQQLFAGRWPHYLGAKAEAGPATIA